MQVTQTNAEVGNFRTFITNGGVHSPETLADITISQLIHHQSNQARVAEIKAMLTDYYAGTQIMVRCLFQITEANPMTRLQITTLLAREISTLLDIERKIGA